ncbi:mechanosensitive ion channel family protein [uncultured Roseobacter sp.]|uniref:mechanosensitive ion channel family protein n=1 Tax=uncultured Roseobacter sp. TaxID=114847 RepID=UPI002607860C|nr:mechanosensitive ion channel family protein [uncultured Roseobacter sp.]
MHRHATTRALSPVVRGLFLLHIAMLASALWLMTALAAPAQTTTADTADTASAPEQQVEIDPVASDTAIAARITRILEATDWYTGLQVTVDEGVVFLDGTTGTDARRTWAQSLGSKTAGVVAVVNRITVQEAVVWSFDPALAELEALARKTVTVLPLVLLALLVLPLAWFAARLVSKLAKLLLANRVRSPFLRVVIARTIAFPVFLVGLYIVLQVAGLTQLAVSLIGGAGVIGIVIGFAFRDIAENFLSSLILSVRRPFQRGDFIEVAGIMGTVKSMSTRSTLISSVEGNEIHIPNATIFKNVIENYTSSPNRRGDFLVGIGYDATVPEAQEIIMNCLAGHKAVLSDPEPMVLVDELGASTVNIRTYYWFDGHLISAVKLKSALLRAVKTALTNAGISMPDEAREVIFPEGVRVLDAGDPEIAQEDVSLPPATPAAEPDATEGEGDLLSETPAPESPPDAEDAADDLLGPR